MKHLDHKGSLTCCLPLLYEWITSLLPGDRTQWNKLGRDGWPQFLVSLTWASICWYPWKIEDEIIISCGDFPNVPLIGSKACINYNPILAMRQLGRFTWDEPEESSLASLVLHDMGASKPMMLQRVIKAWSDVHKIKRVKRKASKETYS